MTQQTTQPQKTPTAKVVPVPTPNPASTAGSVITPKPAPPTTPAIIASPTIPAPAPVVTTPPISAHPVAAVQTVATNFAKATEMQWRIYQANNEWIRFADLKAGALLTANGAMLAATLSALKGNASVLLANPFALSFALLSGGALLVSVGNCLHCISPKTARFHKKHDPKTDSSLFFEHIAGFTKEEYLTRAQEMGSDETAFEQVCQQVWINARVSRKKHEQVTRAIRALAVSIGFALIAALIAWFR